MAALYSFVSYPDTRARRLALGPDTLSSPTSSSTNFFFLYDRAVQALLFRQPRDYTGFLGEVWGAQNHDMPGRIQRAACALLTKTLCWGCTRETAAVEGELAAGLGFSTRPGRTEWEK
jgi:hypothetical protein